MRGHHINETLGLVKLEGEERREVDLLGTDSMALGLTAVLAQVSHLDPRGETYTPTLV